MTREAGVPGGADEQRRAAPDGQTQALRGVHSPALSEDQLARLRSYGSPEDVRVGQILMRPGDAADDFILVDSGRVELDLNALPGAAGVDAETVPTCGPGTFINELGLITGQRAYLTARVTQAGRIQRVPQAAFRRLMGEDPDLSAVVLNALLARRELLRAGPFARSLEIIGSTVSAASLALRTYAARQGLVHSWLEAEKPDGQAVLAAAGLTAADLPVVIGMGEMLRRTTPRDLAELLGLTTWATADGSGTAGSEAVDLTVVGAGPAGLAAAVYAASEGLRTLVLDGVAAGGQAAASSRIENYLGFPTGVSGADLMTRALVQAQKFGARLASPRTVADLGRVGGSLELVLHDGDTIMTRAVVVATGARYRALPLPRWKDFEGTGIYYAATEIEVRACAGQPVVVVGGANSAAQAALHLASRGSEVTLAVRGADLRAGMSAYLADRLYADARMRILTGTQVTALHGPDHLEAVTLTSAAGAQTEPCAGLFCFTGAVPATSWLRGPALDDKGFVRTDSSLRPEDLGPPWRLLGRGPLPYETSVPGVFAAGDVRSGSIKRVAAAVGEGSSAVRSVHTSLAPSTVQPPTGDAAAAQPREPVRAGS